MQLTTISRRTLFQASAAIAGALASPQVMTRAAQAAVPFSSAKAPGFNRFKLGDFEVTALLDGLRPADGPYPTFGADQSQAAMAELMRQNFLPETKFVNGFTPTLVNTGTELVLFDTGLGEGARPNGQGQLAGALRAAGYSPEQVSIVVLTHMHGDHIGGLMEGDAPAFPNARYVAGQAEYDFWTSPDRAGTPAENGAKLVAAKVKPFAEKTRFIKPGEAVVPGITSEAAFGHTPGHMVYRLESSGKQLILMADTANHFVASLQRPDWHVAFDIDKGQAAQTRKRLFDMLAADRLPFIGYHMPFPATGYVEKLDAGYRFVPVSYQMEI